MYDSRFSVRNEMASSHFNEIPQKIELARSSVDNEKLEAIFRNCTLTACDLTNCFKITSIKQLPDTLETLSLRGIPFLSKEIFEVLENCPNLTTLDLSKLHVEWDGLQRLKNLKNLNELFLWRCSTLKDSNLEWLKDRQILRLDVSECIGLTDQSLPFLLGVEELCLDRIDNFSEAGLMVLTTSKQLKKISLWDCRNISNEFLKNYKTHFSQKVNVSFKTYSNTYEFL